MAKIKAIIFDLDDTLFDCTGQLVACAQKRAASAMVNTGLPARAEDVLEKLVEMRNELDPRINFFEKICEDFGLAEKDREKIVNAAVEAYNSDVVEDIGLFDGTKEMLARMKRNGLSLAIVSSGVYSRQMRKIELLGLNQLIPFVFIHDIEKGGSKEQCFRLALDAMHANQKETVCVGDRIQSEIKIGNSLGLTTVRLLYGRFAKLKPKNDLEQPDFEIKNITELDSIIEKIESSGFTKKSEGLKVVAIGGGTGLPHVLKGLRQFTANVTAIVTVTDCGRSTGKIRNDFHIPSPGDLRNCLIALSDDEKMLSKLFQYRFSEGKELVGHNFGNLFLAALSRITGSFEEAVREAGKILAIEGRVLPSTLSEIHLCAELEDSSIVETEVNVRGLHKAPIKRLFLKPSNAKPLPEALKAISEADLIVIGPGSLFTSVIPNLLVNGIADAIRKSRAKKVFVCNAVTQPGQTDGLNALMHVQHIEKYLGKGVLDFVILNNKRPQRKIMDAYTKSGAAFIEPQAKEIESLGIKTIVGDFTEKTKEIEALWEKVNLLRHDPKKIAKVLVSL